MLTFKASNPLQLAYSESTRMSRTSSGTKRPGPAHDAGRRSRSWVAAGAVTLLLAAILCNTALASDRPLERRGKVIIIRGAFTVFSLGMNSLGEKLEERGLDVDVVADISARRAASDVRSAYLRGENVGPIVFIGHSRGAELGPKQARYLAQYDIPVKLVVMVDAVHRTSIPANVERCVNLYHENALSLVHGVPARPESPKTQMLNVDIDRLSTRERGGSINHFNIDASPWIHDLVIAEVLEACPPVTSTAKPAIARQATPAVPDVGQNPIQVTVRWRSPSGLMYPKRIAAGVWALPVSLPASGSRNVVRQSADRTRQSISGGRKSTDKSDGRTRLWHTMPPPKRDRNAKKPIGTRTARRPATSGVYEPDTGQPNPVTSRKPKAAVEQKPKASTSQAPIQAQLDG